MKKQIIIASVILVFLAPLFFAEDAGAWWNNQWQYRKKIVIDQAAVNVETIENLIDIPVLIRLHSGNLDFTHGKEDGQDIRFVGADDVTLLKHHMEKFDAIDEMAIAWVKLPGLKKGPGQNFVWMYYGNPEAAGGEDARGTYDSGHAAVFHLKELEGMPQDTSAYENHASQFSGGLGLPSIIGNGVTFSGAGDHIRLVDSPSLDFSAGFTFSTWIRIQQPMKDAFLFSRRTENAEIIVGIDGTKVYCRLKSGEDQFLATEKTVDLSVNTWHLLAVTAAPGLRLSIFLDGLEMSWIQLPEKLPEFKGDIFVGGSPDTDRSFVGDLDEVKISNVPRSKSWINTEYASQRPEDNLFSLGVEEVGEGGGGLPVFYLATVLKNITLDGWIIIGSLILLSFVSWIIMVSKTFFLWLMEKENKLFLNSYRSSSDPFEIGSENKDFENASLYRIYREGRRGLQTSLNNNVPLQEALEISKADVNTFKNNLEKGLIGENKRLNAWLVILTMSITGGPFLGLLGTVWGVMNTFAAMAEAGEANLMAIAPGVASALSTTVFGLIVAIPALFGYNFLAGKIRNITADLNIFVDELALRIEEKIGGAL